MRSTGATVVSILLWTWLSACSPSKESRCERFAEQGLGMVMAIANEVGDELAGKELEDVALSPEDRALAKKKTIEECMSWPDDFVACMSDGDLDSPKCREAYAKKEGLVVQVDGKPGPAPTMREIGKDAALMCEGGRCLLGVEERLQDLTGQDLGNGSFVGVLEVEGERVLLTAHEGELAFRGKATVTVKAPRTAPDDPLTSPLAVGEGGLALFDDGRIRRLTPPLSEACEGCWQATPWAIGDAYGSPPSAWDFPEIYAVGNGGAVVWLQGGSLRVFEKGVEAPRFTLRERDALGAPLVVGERVYIGAGKEALTLSLAKCRSEEPLAVAALEAAGQGCVEGRMPLPETAFARPQRLGDAVYFLADGRIYQMKGGARGWVAEVEGDALLALERGGKRMLWAAVHWTMDHPARLVALDPDTGTTTLQIDLPATEMSIFDVVLGVDGDALYAQSSRRLYRWELDALAAAL